MTADGIQIRIETRPSFRDIRGRFIKAETAMLDGRLAKLGKQGQRFLRMARGEAPGRTLPGKLGIEYSFATKTRVSFAIYGPEPLLTWVQQGTKPHPIFPRRANALRFHWERKGMLTLVPKGGWFFTGPGAGGVFYIGKGRVDHPGTKANRFIGRAYRRWLPGARADMAKLSDLFVRTYDGQSVTVNPRIKR